MTNVTDPLGRFLAALDVEPLGADRFRATSPAGRRRRIFGGLAMAQALVAAARTLEDGALAPRSLHTLFVRAGDPHEPVALAVERVSDGRVFATRHVTAAQQDTTLFHALARFGFDAPGPTYQRDHGPVDVPEPASLVGFPTYLAPHRDLVPDWADGDLPVDARVADDGSSSAQLLWFRAAGPLDDRSLVHACTVLYASDMTLLGVAARPHGRIWADAGVVMASLDHAIWFHGPFRADEWLLYEQQTLAHGSSLALVTGSVYDANRRLVATVLQDGLVRLPAE
jgi:acyl-CoA thioesterase-2